MDRALGDASESAEFKRVYGGLGKMNPYYTQPGVAGRQETFAEGFAAWVKNRHMPPDQRADAIANALDMRADKRSQGALLDGFFSDLESKLG